MIAGLPWLYFTLLFIQGGNMADPCLPALVLFVLAVAAGLGATIYRAGTRAARRAHPDTTA